MSSAKLIDSPLGIFVGQRRGVCIKLSVPAQTNNDWNANMAFLDLPLMDRDTFENFVSCLNEMKQWFEE